MIKESVEVPRAGFIGVAAIYANAQATLAVEHTSVARLLRAA